jgi:deoxycytidylate deaminase
VIGEVELRHALMEAKSVALHTSRCLRKKVGAVLYDPEGKFLAYGANINPPGQPCDEGFCPRGQRSYADQPVNAPYADCTAWHAEMVALLLAKERLGGGPPQDVIHSIAQEGVLVQLRGGTMVVTHEPCHECMPRLRVLRLNIYWPDGKVLA